MALINGPSSLLATMDTAVPRPYTPVAASGYNLAKGVGSPGSNEDKRRTIKVQDNSEIHGPKVHKRGCKSAVEGGKMDGGDGNPGECREGFANKICRLGVPGACLAPVNLL